MNGYNLKEENVQSYRLKTSYQQRLTYQTKFKYWTLNVTFKYSKTKKNQSSIVLSRNDISKKEKKYTENEKKELNEIIKMIFLYVF